MNAETPRTSCNKKCVKRRNSGACSLEMKNEDTGNQEKLIESSTKHLEMKNPIELETSR